MKGRENGVNTEKYLASRHSPAPRYRGNVGAAFTCRNGLAVGIVVTYGAAIRIRCLANATAD